MRYLLIVGATALLFGSGASAATAVDPTGDFLASYLGVHEGDLDVTSFSVKYDAVQSSFLLNATFAGAIDATKAGFYAIGVNTGTGVAHPFGSIGEGNVLFNQVIALQKAGTATVGATSLAAGAVTIAGNSFSAWVPLSLLPSTGFSPDRYGFNLWPRDGTAGLGAISDFSPENATLAAVPEVGIWAMMIAGFGLTGRALRQRRSGKPGHQLTA